MCGRFVSSSPPDELARYFDAEPGEGVAPPAAEPAAAGASATDATNATGPADGAHGGGAPESAGPNYNVAPSTGVYVVRSDGAHRRLERFRWGLVPSWAKDVSIGNKMINARVETVASKPVFRRALAKRRCIIPADGFYEWTAVPGQRKKQPWFIHRPDGEPYAFAGLWEVWRPPSPDPGGSGGGAAGTASPVLRSCTIITCPANEAMAPLHDRMPVMLPPAAWAAWLDPSLTDAEVVGEFLVPAPPEVIAFHPVSTEVNNVRNGGSQLIEPVPLVVAGAGDEPPDRLDLGLDR